MISHNVEIRTYLRPWARYLDCLLRQRTDGGGYAIAEPIAMRTLNQDEGIADDIKPSFSIRLDAAQQLMDDLWKAGLRPSEGSGSAGALRATEAHLTDMQRIVFDLLPVLHGPLRIVDMADPNGPTMYPHQGPMRPK